MTDAAVLRAFAQELVAAGVTDAVVCPGSRSTPLALALRATRACVSASCSTSGRRVLRAGLARASRRPVAVLVTSGTAVVELLPAVVEASLARVPLVVLTADRPPELRDRGAPQTIDQVGIFGRHAKWFAELPLLDGTPATRRHVRSVVGRAVATARGGPAGPVHLNIAVPRAAAARRTARGPGRRRRRAPAVHDGRRRAGAALDPTGDRALAARLGRGASAGSSWPGPQDDPALPAALGAPGRGDRLPDRSPTRCPGVRCGPHDRSLVAGPRATSSSGPGRGATPTCRIS